MAVNQRWAGVGVLSAVGGTPLVELVRLLPGADVRLYAKLESVNPGGSIKDRSAVGMLSAAIRSGAAVPGRTTVVESSSGNLGIGLAQACRYLDLCFVCVVDPRTNAQNVAVMRAFGADVVTVTSPDPATGEYLTARVRRVQELVRTLPDAYWPNQYANPDNAAAHHRTMQEIVDGLGRPPDYLFCAISSCGTLRGCVEHIRTERLPVTVVAVDAEGSGIVRPPSKARRLLPGHGAATPPALYDAALADHVVHVSDLDCLLGCRRLVAREAILAGGSSGGVVRAVERMHAALPRGATCVLILPDDGSRYLDTVYDDDWVAEYFGVVAGLSGEPAAEPDPVMESTPC